MRRRPWRWVRRSRLTTIAVSAVVVIGAFGSASAASFGGLAAGSIFTSDAAVTNTAPTVLACDDFSLPASTGASLNNRPVQLPANCGSSTWTTHRGTWTIANGELRGRTANASATVSAGATDVSAQATVRYADAGNNSAAGVAIDHSGATGLFLAGVVGAGNLAELRLVNGNSVTTLASTTAAVGPSTVVRLTRQGTIVTLRVNGAVVLTATLSPTDASALTGIRAGLYWSRGNSVRFADFLTTQAAP